CERARRVRYVRVLFPAYATSIGRPLIQRMTHTHTPTTTHPHTHTHTPTPHVRDTYGLKDDDHGTTTLPFVVPTLAHLENIIDLY
ncbi:hypothetical protein THAOC_20040, partial [Thalassiosira oceanica]